MTGLDEIDRESIRLLTEDARLPIGRSRIRSIARRRRSQNGSSAYTGPGVIERFTVDLDRSMVIEGSKALVELDVGPTHDERVAETVESVPAVEHVIRTVDGAVLCLVHTAQEGSATYWRTSSTARPSGSARYGRSPTQPEGRSSARYPSKSSASSAGRRPTTAACRSSWAIGPTRSVVPCASRRSKTSTTNSKAPPETTERAKRLSEGQSAAGRPSNREPIVRTVAYFRALRPHPTRSAFGLAPQGRGGSHFRPVAARTSPEKMPTARRAAPPIAYSSGTE